MWQLIRAIFDEPGVRFALKQTVGNRGLQFVCALFGRQ